MKQARILREKERLFAIRYGTEQPPNPLDGEDLQSNDLADAEHWVQVYRAVVGLTHGVRGPRVTRRFGMVRRRKVPPRPVGP